MWARALAFALLYALPEFLLFFVWTGAEGIAYSGFVGVICAISMARLTGNLRVAVIGVCAAFYAFPLYLIIPNWGLRIDFSPVFAGRFLWFAIATSLLVFSQRQLAKRVSDRPNNH